MDTLPDEISHAEINHYDPTSYVNLAKKLRKTLKPRVTKPVKLDYEQLQPCFAFLPTDIIRKTMDCTTQLAKWCRRLPLRRHWQARFPYLNIHRLSEEVATDTYFANCQAIGGHTCTQVFYGIRSHMINVYHMKTESEGPSAYEDFIREQGCPTLLRRDNSKMQNGNDFTNICRFYGVKDGFTEPHHPHQNPAENRAVNWLKQHSELVMNKTGAPPSVWTDCATWIADIHNIVADESLGNRTPYEKRHGSTPDISAYMLFTFWEKILYFDTEQSYPESKECPGRFLGIAKHSGDALTFVILSENGTRLTRSVIRSASGKQPFGFPNARITHPEFAMTPIPPMIDPQINPRQSKGEGISRIDEVQPITLEDPKQNKKQQIQNQKVNTGSGELGELGELNLPTQPTPKKVTFSGQPIKIDKTLNFKKRRKKRKSAHREPNQRYNLRPNKVRLAQVARIVKKAVKSLAPELLTTTPHVKVPEKEDCLCKIDDLLDEGDEIKEDKKTRKLLVYHHILDSSHQPEDPEDMHQNYTWKVDKIVRHVWNGRRTFVRVLWKQGNRSWISINNLRLHDPIACVIYAIKMKLVGHQQWDWVTDYIQDTETYSNMIVALKTRQAFQSKYKFGVEVPRSLRHARKLDEQNGNTLWKEAILKELKQLDDYNTFKLVQDEKIEDYQEIPYHFVFDVKFDLRHKARLVAGGNHCEELPKEDTYSGVISLTAVRILFLITTLHKLDLIAADVANAYLNGINKAKVYILAGPEFGERQGMKLIIYKGLYGLAGSGARFHEHLSATLRKLGFKPSKADPNLWIRDLGTHYEYVGTYVDDLLIASKDATTLIQEIEEAYILKGVGEPVYYLGGDINMVSKDWKEEPTVYQLSATTYVQNIVEKFKQLLGEGVEHYAFPSRATPMAEDYHPELDESTILDEEQGSRYRSIIGSLMWAVTLGRFDIQYATVTLARYANAPREGHMQAARRILGYLSKFRKGKLMIDPSKPKYDDFQEQESPYWKEYYPDATEELPPDMPEPKGQSCKMTIFVDADHARDQVTRRSVTGIAVFINNTLVKTYSKRQTTVESSTYGSELVAARIATDMAVELRYTMRMLGIPIEGPNIIFGDNKSVILNTTLPSSILKKKHNAIAYHRVREAIAGKIIQFHHVASQNNLADVLTKPLPSQTFHPLIKPILFRNPGEDRWVKLVPQ